MRGGREVRGWLGKDPASVSRILKIPAQVLLHCRSLRLFSHKCLGKVKLICYLDAETLCRRIKFHRERVPVSCGQKQRSLLHFTVSALLSRPRPQPQAPRFPLSPINLIGSSELNVLEKHMK